MAKDRIKNYAQGTSEINLLKDIRTDLSVTPSTYTPDTSTVTKDRLVTFAQAEEELVVLGDVERGVRNLVGDVNKNENDITNIKALLQGHLYDYQTDSTSGYTKTVPSGAMPYAGLEKVGGKTIVWNQYVQDPTIVYTTNNNIAFAAGTTFFAGHYYYIGYEYNGEGSYSSINIVTKQGETPVQFMRAIGTSTIVQSPITITSNGTASQVEGNVWIYQYNGAADSTTNIQVVDLTLMFGSGNEPSTVAEYQAMFPAIYAYSAPKLLSAGVIEVASQSVNIAYYGDGAGVPSDITFSNETKRIFPIGKYIVGTTTDNYYAPVNISAVSTTDNSVTVTSTNGGYGIGIPFDCKSGDTFTVSTSTVAFTNMWSVTWYSADGTLLSYAVKSVSSFTVVTPSGAKQGLLNLRPTANTPTTYSNIQIEKGETATTFVPAKAPITFPIPTAIRNLEGYGWSAGTVYNYIDFERKVFVQRLKRVDLSSITWTYEENGVFRVYNMNDYKNQGEIINAKYTNWTGDGSLQTAPDLSVGIVNGQVNPIMRIKNIAYTTSADLDASFTDDNKYAYIELYTPVETDISEYLTDDNLINVESGGTLTFPNQNGDDYQIPVPSEEEYMIDLQEAL